MVQDEQIMWSMPAFVEIAHEVIADVRRGRLRAGDRLPSTREMADGLGVSRNTVVAAFRELYAEGWIVSRGAAGTFVADDVPERTSAGSMKGLAPKPAFAMAEVSPLMTTSAPGAKYLLSAGIPDTRSFPTSLLARAYRRAMRSPSGRSGLDYGTPYGVTALREAIAAMLRSARGVPAGADNVLVTRGSQMALDTISRALVAPGDAVGIEELCYPPAAQTLEANRAVLRGVPLDGAGIVVDELPACRMIYVTPHHQYPTTVLMSPARRQQLLATAAKARMAIVEDDYDHEFHFDGRPVAPLAANDRAGCVLYIGSLSKSLAPGLRLGYVVGPKRAIDTLAALRARVDRQGDHVLEAAVAELLADGELPRHARKMRREYASRRTALVEVLQRELGSVLSFTVPPGGLTLWARVADDVDAERWRRRALDRGVAVATGRAFDLQKRPLPYLRLAFSHHDAKELAEGVRRLRLSL